MLARDFRFHIVNNTGAQINFGSDGGNNSFVLTSRPWKFDSNGAVQFSGAESTWFADPTSNLADGASLVASAAVDNSTDKWIGAHCHGKLETNASVAGTLDIYVEYSTDGGTTWPSDSADTIVEQDLPQVGKIECSPSAQNRSTNFQV